MSQAIDDFVSNPLLQEDGGDLGRSCCVNSGVALSVDDGPREQSPSPVIGRDAHTAAVSSSVYLNHQKPESGDPVSGGSGTSCCARMGDLASSLNVPTVDLTQPETPTFRKKHQSQCDAFVRVGIQAAGSATPKNRGGGSLEMISGPEAERMMASFRNVRDIHSFRQNEERFSIVPDDAVPVSDDDESDGEQERQAATTMVHWIYDRPAPIHFCSSRDNSSPAPEAEVSVYRPKQIAPPPVTHADLSVAQRGLLEIERLKAGRTVRMIPAFTELSLQRPLLIRRTPDPYSIRIAPLKQREVPQVMSHLAARMALDTYNELLACAQCPSRWFLDYDTLGRLNAIQRAVFFDCLHPFAPCGHHLSGEPADYMKNLFSGSATGVIVILVGKEYPVHCGRCVRRFANVPAKVYCRDEVLVFEILASLPGGSRRGEQRREQKAKKQTAQQSERERKTAEKSEAERQRWRPKDKQPREGKPTTHDVPPGGRAKVEQTYADMSPAPEEEEEQAQEAPCSVARVDEKGYGPSGESSSSLDADDDEASPEGAVIVPPSKPTQRQIHNIDCDHRSGRCPKEISCWPIKRHYMRVEVPLTYTDNSVCLTASGINAALSRMVNERYPEPGRLSLPSPINDVYSYARHLEEIGHPLLAARRDTSHPDDKDVADALKYIKDRFANPPEKKRQSEHFDRNVSICGQIIASMYPAFDGPSSSCPAGLITLDQSFLDRFYQLYIERRVFSKDTRGSQDFEWAYLPDGCSFASVPNCTRGYVPFAVSAVTVRSFPHTVVTFVQKKAIFLPLAGISNRLLNTFSHRLLTFTSVTGKPVSMVHLKHATILPYLDKVCSLTVKQKMFGFKPAPLSPGYVPNPWSRACFGPFPAPIPPPMPEAEKSNAFPVGTVYEFNTDMHNPQMKNIIKTNLNIRQKLLATGILTVSPWFLGLDPGPIGVDPGSSVRVECVSGPLRDITFDGHGHKDLRSDHARNAELLHEESLVQRWKFQRFYCGHLRAEAIFTVDSNVLTTVMSGKNALSCNLSPATRQVLLCEETHRASMNTNVAATYNQLVLDVQDAAALVLQAKAANKLEARNRLGSAGASPLF